MNFGYLIDMDGVVYRDNQLIPGAQRFIHELQDADVPFMFLTNNSQRTRRDGDGVVFSQPETARHRLCHRRRRLAAIHE